VRAREQVKTSFSCSSLTFVAADLREDTDMTLWTFMVRGCSVQSFSVQSGEGESFEGEGGEF